VKVMLRVSPGDGGSFFSADKRKKQVTLVDPASGQSSSAEDRRPTVAAPKMFAFDAIFTEEDSQTEICSSALTDVIHAVINGTDGCLFCFGHAGLGKSHTMLGTPEAGHTLGAIPCAIAWLFRGISEQRQRTGARFSVRVSCVELTTGQQQLRDLLAAHANDSEQSPAVYLRDDPLFGTLQLQQHSELRAPTAERAAFYLDAAVAGRQREDGDAHMLYTLHVYQYSVAGKGGVAGGRSRLHLMDLGNSDRGKSSGGIPLSGLGNILLAIFNGQKHLPYKEHKLTQLLKECLGSLTCHAAMIAHVSPNAQHYTETLTTVQLASRIHRMRRRKIKFVGSNTQGTGSGGSSGEEAARQNSECDPSSSDLSADTVIYVGPSADDATDGEHPPVYIPSLNSGDNRCAMGRVLRGSAAERPNKIPEERSPAHKPSKVVKTLTQTASKQTSPAHSITPKASPARKNSSSKNASASKANDSPSKVPLAPSGGSDEQWIDGPRISKSKVAEARHMLKESHHKRETWIDGPMQLTGAPALQLHTHQHSSGYGFMDSHKKSMIRKWVENQSSQIQRAKHATPRLESSKMSSGQSSGLDLTASPVMDDSIDKGKLDLPDDEDDDEEIVVPPPLPLIEPLSNGVSREVSMESLNLSHKDIVLPSRHSLSSEDEILEIVEVEDLEPVPMQDSCLQVTEEDIALCMGENPLPESDQEEHPLRILSQENLTVVSTFTDSMSVMSDTERYRPHYPPPVGAGVLPRPYFDHEDFLEQETRHKFDQLARLHELYQSKLALANVSNSVTYQRENSSTVNVRDAPCGSPLLSMPSPAPSSGRMQRKILSLGSSFGLNKEGSDSGADTTPRAAKLSPATLSRHRAESSGYDSIVRDSETSSIASDSSRQTGALQEHQAVEQRAAGCGPRRSRAHCQAQLGPPAASEILAYTGEDVDILDRRARVRSNPRGTISRIHSLRLRQRLLRLELRDAKRRLMVPDARWDYNLYVEDSMDWRDPSFLEALMAETCILQKRVEACKSHVLLVTCFDSCPQESTSAEIKIT
ncbi:hypothetical protein ALC53_10981, partial [Atta colombica]